jgi:hypothetical protein
MAKKCGIVVRGRLFVVLDKSSKGYQYILDASEKFHLHPVVFEWTSYSKTEIEKLSYFEMKVQFPMELEGIGPDKYGTQYTGGCYNCGLGGKLVSDVLIDRKFLKKYKIGNLDPDLYVSEDIKQLVISNNFSGITFEHKIIDYKGRAMPKFFTCDIHNVLPPMSASAWLVKAVPDRCYEACGHSIVYIRSNVKYENEKLCDANDFNLTEEFVDNFRIRKIIVSARVRNLFKNNKIQAGFFPVETL